MDRIKNKTVPLLCWDICAMSLHEISQDFIREQELSALQELQRRFGWNIELDSVLRNPYEALVLTDNQQIIQWANRGFRRMTGYPVDYALGKSPRFLQGPRSSTETKSRIREKLSQATVFTETIVNYRKNGEEYLCEIHIFPIKDREQQLTHFLALEQEV